MKMKSLCKNSALILGVAFILTPIFEITLLLVFCLLAGFAYAQPVPVTGTLKTAVPVPLVLNGKQVGSTTLPAGTKVTVVQESAGKTLVKAAIGETWVASDVLDVAPSEPAATAPEAPAQTATVTAAPSTQAEVPAAPAAAKKKALIWGTFLDETVYAGKAALEKAGFTVDIVSPTGWIQRMQYGTVIDEKQNGIPTVTAANLPTTAKDYNLVWLALEDPTKEGIQAITALDKQNKVVVLDGYSSDTVSAILKNDAEKAEKISREAIRKTECGKAGRNILYFDWGMVKLSRKQEKELLEAQHQIYKENPGIQALEMLKLLKPQEDAAYAEARRNRPASEIEKINTFLTKDIVQAANQAAQ